MNINETIRNKGKRKGCTCKIIYIPAAYYPILIALFQIKNFYIAHMALSDQILFLSGIDGYLHDNQPDSMPSFLVTRFGTPNKIAATTPFTIKKYFKQAFK